MMMPNASMSSITVTSTKMTAARRTGVWLAALTHGYSARTGSRIGVDVDEAQELAARSRIAELPSI